MADTLLVFENNDSFSPVTLTGDTLYFYKRGAGLYLSSGSGSINELIVLEDAVSFAVLLDYASAGVDSNNSVSIYATNSNNELRSYTMDLTTLSPVEREVLDYSTSRVLGSRIDGYHYVILLDELSELSDRAEVLRFEHTAANSLYDRRFIDPAIVKGSFFSDSSGSNETIAIAYTDAQGGVLNVGNFIPYTNSAPTDIAISNNLIFPTQVVGDPIGELIAIDPDLDDTHTFQIISSTPANAFSIDGNVLKLAVDASTLVPADYAVVVRITDSGSATVDAPVILTLLSASELSLLERQSVPYVQYVSQSKGSDGYEGSWYRPVKTVSAAVQKFNILGADAGIISIRDGDFSSESLVFDGSNTLTSLRVFCRRYLGTSPNVILPVISGSPKYLSIANAVLTSTLDLDGPSEYGGTLRLYSCDTSGMSIDNFNNVMILRSQLGGTVDVVAKTVSAISCKSSTAASYGFSNYKDLLLLNNTFDSAASLELTPVNSASVVVDATLYVPITQQILDTGSYVLPGINYVVSYIVNNTGSTTMLPGDATISGNLLTLSSSFTSRAAVYDSGSNSGDNLRIVLTYSADSLIGRSILESNSITNLTGAFTNNAADPIQTVVRNNNFYQSAALSSFVGSDNNIDADPLYNPDLSLQPGSPNIGAGRDERYKLFEGYLTASINGEDFLGLSRNRVSSPLDLDIGAYSAASQITSVGGAVSPTGMDSGADGSVANPYRTVASALEALGTDPTLELQLGSYINNSTKRTLKEVYESLNGVISTLDFSDNTTVSQYALVADTYWVAGFFGIGAKDGIVFVSGRDPVGFSSATNNYDSLNFESNRDGSFFNPFRSIDSALELVASANGAIHTIAIEGGYRYRAPDFLASVYGDDVAVVVYPKIIYGADSKAITSPNSRGWSTQVIGDVGWTRTLGVTKFTW